MKRFQFTIKDLLILMAVVVFLLGCLIAPWILRMREDSRRMACTRNLMQLGAGMHNFVNAQGQFPPSAQIADKGGKKEVSGWSFIIDLLPSMEDLSSNQYCIYDSLPKGKKVIDPLTSADPAILKAKQFRIPLLHCPSNPNRVYGETKSGQSEIFTNYKAMGAATAESLRQCIDPGEPPPYDSKVIHPDGAIFPGKGTRIMWILDGTSYTFMLVETMDDLHSVWLAGTDATLVGMPKTLMDKPPERYFWAPKGFNGKFGEEASSEVQALRTYLGFDFRPSGKDEGSYPSSVGRTPKYGPSSAHPGVVNHLLCDGAVRSVSTQVDYAMYFFAITRRGGEYFPWTE